VITARIKDLYNLNTDGSEQGMQGDDYISLDVWMDNFDDREVTDEQLDADEDDTVSENYLKQFCRFELYPGVTNGDLRQAVLAS
jgi:hypothetical protein